MLPTFIVTLASAVSAASIFSRDILQDVPGKGSPLDCVPLSWDCIHGIDLATVSCAANGKNQVCQKTGSTTITEMVGRPCSNSTYNPHYPLTNACRDILDPYDAAKIPSDCSTTMCTGMDGAPAATWCLYFQGTGMQWRRLQMQCAPGASPTP